MASIDQSAKKNLMYISGEDFYLFAYATFALLDALGCKNGRFFSDYRKLSFLIEFVKDRKFNSILMKSEERELTSTDREYLFQSYTSALGRTSEILKILLSLEKRNLVELRRKRSTDRIDVTLLTESFPEEYFGTDLFREEYQRVEELRSHVKNYPFLLSKQCCSVCTEIKDLTHGQFESRKS